MEMYTQDECVWVTYDWAVRYCYDDQYGNRQSLIPNKKDLNPYIIKPISDRSTHHCVYLPKSKIIHYLQHCWFDGNTLAMVVEISIFRDVIFKHIYSKSIYHSYHSKDGKTGVIVKFE